MRIGFRKGSSVEKIKNKCMPVPRMYQRIVTNKLILYVSQYRNCFFTVQDSTNTFIYYTGGLFNPSFGLRYTSTFHDNCSTTEGFKDIKPKFIINRKCDSFDRKVKESFSFKKYR
jgi:hypothetical protein